MAKMKVYELAKEIGVESKDILAALKNKGIEVKSHMSVIEDELIEEVKGMMKDHSKSADEHSKEESKKAEEKAKPQEASKEQEPKKKMPRRLSM